MQQETILKLNSKSSTPTTAVCWYKIPYRGPSILMNSCKNVLLAMLITVQTNKKFLPLLEPKDYFHGHKNLAILCCEPHEYS
jgi:hypothetical protein